MDSLLSKQPIVVKSEERGHHEGWIFALVLIFLAVIFIAFRDKHERHHDDNYGGAAAILPFASSMLANKQPCSDRHDHMEIIKDQAVDTGKIIHDIDVQTCTIRSEIAGHTNQMEKGFAHVIEKQQQSALEAERQANARYIDEKNEKLAELRLALAGKDARILHEETVNAVQRGNSELNGRLDKLFCRLENRLTRVEDHMLKQPPFFAAGGTAAKDVCIPSGLFAEGLVPA